MGGLHSRTLHVQDLLNGHMKLLNLVALQNLQVIINGACRFWTHHTFHICYSTLSYNDHTPSSLGN